MVQNGRLKLPTTNISNSFALEKDLWCVESQLQHILILRSPCTQNQDGKWQWQKMEIMYFAQNGIWLISAAILNTLDRRYWKNVPVQSQNVSPVDEGAKQVALIVRTYAPGLFRKFWQSWWYRQSWWRRDDEGDSSDAETEYNGYEQDYVYTKDNCADEELLEMINNDEDG